jgi:transcription initiation factor TFIIB
VVCFYLITHSFFLLMCSFLKPRFCNQLELSQEIIVRKAAIHIADRADQICDIQGRAPRSIASAAIYLACLAAHENKTKKG